MDKEMLTQRIDQLQQAFDLQKKQMMKQYCDAKNPYKVGDKFTDHIGTIVIEKIGYSYYGGNPCCVFTGVGLKKDGTPRKDNNNKRNAWQSNDIVPGTSL